MVSTHVFEFLQAKLRANAFTAASVLYAEGGKIVLESHIGTLSAQARTPVDHETVFDLQSMTKTLSTSIVSCILHQQGVIRLDEEIDRYVPGKAPFALRGKGITFEHLLTHSSGLSDVDLEKEFSTAYEFWNEMFSVGLHFSPGASIEYCDIGYRVLGKLLELKLGKNLELAAHQTIFDKVGATLLSYVPFDSFNVAGTPNVHGLIDDDQVRQLGGVVGCDGLFGNARSIFQVLHGLNDGNICEGYAELILGHTKTTSAVQNTFFDALLLGSKSIGWEVNPRGLSYAGKFHSKTCFEKAGGAGTFMWFDPTTQGIFIYLTNHGKPKPFNDKTWNDLVERLSPHELSDLIYEGL